jgi:hypothetical protein
MSNPGNTGQRYKMAKLVALEARGNKVLHVLDCGHNYEATWDTPESAAQAVEFSQRNIGRRQRCNRCQSPGNVAEDRMRYEDWRKNTFPGECLP